jgi:hypothetical protein
MNDRNPSVISLSADSNKQLGELIDYFDAVFTRLTACEQRVAALEAQTAPETEPEFKPGWLIEGGGALLTGIGYTRDDWPIIRLYYEKGDTETNLILDFDSEMKLGAVGLRQLVGAIMLILNQMEAQS